MVAINRKQRRFSQLKARNAPKICIHGSPYTIDEAYSLAVKHAEHKNTAEAIAIYRNILQNVENHAPSLNALGSLVFHDNIDAAIELYTRAIHHMPTFYAAYSNLGYAYISTGRMQEAEKMLRKAIMLKPDHASANYNLVIIRKYTDVAHEDVIRIKKSLTMHPKKPEYLYFALGKIYGDCGFYEEEFSYYHKANQLKNAAVSFNKDMLSQQTSSIMETFSEDFLTHYASPASTSQTPVFIVGMPRSGTTLLTNILSNHPAIGTAGELNTLHEIIHHLPRVAGTDIPYPQAAHHVTPSVSLSLAQHYETRLKRDATSDVTYIIDKHPLNFWHLGLIYMLFPLAKVIHCARHPLDTCISNYFQCFSEDYQYSFDLDNTGHYYKEYRKIMTHWQRALPTRILEINYEDMVANTEQTAKKALTFLNLDFDEKCLAPHMNQNVIKTASMWQVRQPIYTQSVERWKHYEKYLAPLKELLL